MSMAGRLASSATVGGTRLPGSPGDIVSHAIAPSPARVRGNHLGLFITLPSPESAVTSVPVGFVGSGWGGGGGGSPKPVGLDVRTGWTGPAKGERGTGNGERGTG